MQKEDSKICHISVKPELFAMENKTKMCFRAYMYLKTLSIDHIETEYSVGLSNRFVNASFRKLGYRPDKRENTLHTLYKAGLLDIHDWGISFRKTSSYFIPMTVGQINFCVWNLDEKAIRIMLYLLNKKQYQEKNHKLYFDFSYRQLGIEALGRKIGPNGDGKANALLKDRLDILKKYNIIKCSDIKKFVDGRYVPYHSLTYASLDNITMD